MKTRSDIRREYKETSRPMGIVLIKNSANGRMMLIPSENPDAAIRRYKFELSLGSCWRKDMQNDWNMDSGASFSFEILDTFMPDPSKKPKEELAEFEAIWREKLASELTNEYK